MGVPPANQKTAASKTSNPKKDQPACAEVERVPVVPGASSVWDDLPAALVVSPATLLSYRVEVFNSVGRSAGKPTAMAFAVAGEAPPPVESLQAKTTETGSVIEWRRPSSTDGMAVELTRIDLTAPAASGHKAAPAAPAPAHRTKSKPAPAKPVQTASNEVHLRTPEAAAASAGANGWAGTIDDTAIMGETYSYVAERVRTVTLAGHALEVHSQPSAPITLAMRDTFPPKSPVGLATIPGTSPAVDSSPAISYIDLSWEPNTEPDLAGYLVYRQLARPNGDPEGPIGKLTASHVTAPAYRDVAVRPGQRYIYSVTAVDASGNESAPSAKALEVAEPQNVVGSPQ